MKKRHLLALLFALLCALFALPAAASAQKGWAQGPNGETYYYGSNGEKRTGGPYAIRKDGVKALYLFDTDGKLIKNRVTKLGEHCYLSLADGTLLTTLQKYKGEIYCGSKRGVLLQGKQVLDGQIYYFRKNGTAVRNAQKKIGKDTYFFKANGTALRGKTRVINGKKCYFDDQGHKVFGVQKVGKYYYGFHHRTGAMLYGWRKQKGKHYYFQSNKHGRACANGFYKIDGKVYFFDSTGVRRTGWLLTSDKRYYLDPADNGARVTGKKTIGGITYQFGSDGAVALNPDTPKTIRVNRSKNVVTIYEGNVPIKAMACSVGLNGSTPIGQFAITDHLRWWDLDGPSVGQYCSHFLPDFLFHSVPMDGTARNPYNVKAYKFNLLGQAASSGCIRLCVADAKWIYDNVPIGSSVIISDTEATPLGKPTLPKMKEGSIGKDPTDKWS